MKIVLKKGDEIISSPIPADEVMVRPKKPKFKNTNGLVVKISGGSVSKSVNEKTETPKEVDEEPVTNVAETTKETKQTKKKETSKKKTSKEESKKIDFKTESKFIPSKEESVLDETDKSTTDKELDDLDPGIVVENVHIGDSLMTLCYELRVREEESN